jgi:hypothetical protein
VDDFFDVGTDVALSANGELAYIANNDGLRIVDISDPASPIMRGEYNGGGGFSDIGVFLNEG